MAENKNNDAAKAAAEKALAAARAKKTAAKEEAKRSAGSEYNGITEAELLAATRKNALPFRIGAIVCWILAIVCEVFAILFFTIKLDWGFLYEEPGHTIAWIVALVVDLILVIVGSLLWKRGNHLDPAKKSQPARFWIQNNLGVIIAAIAFIPFIIFALTDKNATKKSKLLATIAAVVALLIGVLFGIDWNPLSQEEMLENAHIDTVYWTNSGTVYHAFYDECYHIAGKEHNTTSSAEAIKEGKTRMCKYCESKLEKEAGTAEDNSKTPDTSSGLSIDTSADN